MLSSVILFYVNLIAWCKNNTDIMEINWTINVQFFLSSIFLCVCLWHQKTSYFVKIFSLFSWVCVNVIQPSHQLRQMLTFFFWCNEHWRWHSSCLYQLLPACKAAWNNSIKIFWSWKWGEGPLASLPCMNLCTCTESRSWSLSKKPTEPRCGSRPAPFLLVCDIWFFTGMFNSL